ncbi:hypothetical protein PIB30_030848 [Stylosanthes scabra]|uniref:Uncharacterized protein n=1 Tax=Stylosanthes scabra TaxID=79078 RepID=A0ABU6UB38_9FABA|nr:hypothetical protein [Stylosanthes scabra]
MRVRKRRFGLRVQWPSRGRAMARARACGQMRPKNVSYWARADARSEGCGRAVRSARAPGPCSSWSENFKREGADAPRPSCGCKAVLARQERGANAPHTCVASAKCHQAHYADMPRPSRGRAIKMVRARGGVRLWILAISDRAAAPPRGAVAPLPLFQIFLCFFSFPHFFVG